MTDVLEREIGGFESRLLPVLLEVVEERARPRPKRPRRRRSFRRAGAVALAAAAVVAGGAIAVGGNDSIWVTAVDAVANPQRVEGELRAAGIDARILVVPVDPEMAGTWWHLYFPPGAEVDPLAWAKLKAQVGVGVLGLPEDILDAGRGVYHRKVIELPGNLTGPVTLVAARSPRADEVPAAMDNELAPDGAFYCYRLERLPPEEAGRVLERLGYRVAWVYETFESQYGESTPVDEPPPGSVTTLASFRSPKLVDVRLAPPAVADELRTGAGTPVAGEAPPSWAPECRLAG